MASWWQFSFHTLFRASLTLKWTLPPPWQHQWCHSIQFFICFQKKLLFFYSGSHLFYAKLWTVADQKPMVKIMENMKNYGMVCPPPQNQKEDKKPAGSYHNHLHPFFEHFGSVSTSNVPSYEWSSWQLRTRRAASVRMFDHKRERCTVCSQCAPLPSTLHPLSLMKKVSFDCFQPFFVWFYLEK